MHFKYTVESKNSCRKQPELSLLVHVPTWLPGFQHHTDRNHSHYPCNDQTFIRTLLTKRHLTMVSLCDITCGLFKFMFFKEQTAELLDSKNSASKCFHVDSDPTWNWIWKLFTLKYNQVAKWGQCGGAVVSTDASQQQELERTSVSMVSLCLFHNISCPRRFILQGKNHSTLQRRPQQDHHHMSNSGEEELPLAVPASGAAIHCDSHLSHVMSALPNPGGLKGYFSAFKFSTSK